MKKTIAILGATGKVGSKIAENLLLEGHNLILLTRTVEKLKKLGQKGATIVPTDITDGESVANAFKQADSAFVMLPPDFTAPSYRAFQRKVGEAIVEGIGRSGVEYIVNLSSCGAHLSEGNGLIAGLFEQEGKLDKLRIPNVLHLRAAYFMDNALLNIDLIKNMGIYGGTADPDHKIPIVDTRDIAAVAAAALANPEFIGKSVLPVLGDRNYSFKEFAAILGTSIGKPDLPYVQFPVDQARQAMVNMGLSPDVACDITNMETGLKNGIMNYEQRTKANSTPTSAEIFAKEVFAPLYNQSK